ncbi:DUF7577 domain-containing protein [Salinilacihabitans rarus]|uniref:DUF7577 domain-containing protein n=1 Tax=Salinilacihabitans rarus TaxID=2961596 RepID=UPI0020C90F87|nr:hypothetical protein [Salinilacihabitans rarus]
MELWQWLVGYVVLFALLHLLLYYFYARRGNDDGSPAPSLTNGNHASFRPPGGSESYPGPVDDPDGSQIDHDHDALEFDGETVTCPRCGATNEADPTFTYCWNCISTLRR